MKVSKIEKDIRMIGGKPIDFHVISDYLLNVSPYDINSILRFNNIGNLEEIKMYRKPMEKVKGMWKLIIIIAIVAVIGVFMIMFLPAIMEKLTTMFRS